MVDASAYEIEENIARTKKVVDLCHVQGLAVEGELGHVGQAATLDGCDEMCIRDRFPGGRKYKTRPGRLFGGGVPASGRHPFRSA